MRYKPEHKEQTHQKIVESASREFRTRGFEGVGIAKLMGDLNLTHGGFYAHFADKESLVAASFVLALDQILEVGAVRLKEGGLRAVLDYYLSEAHRDMPEAGCPLPSLAAELARHSAASRDAVTANLPAFFDAVVEYMPGQTLEQKRAKVYAMFAALSGAVSLARAVSDPFLSKAILDATHSQLLHLLREEAD